MFFAAFLLVLYVAMSVADGLLFKFSPLSARWWLVAIIGGIGMGLLFIRLCADWWGLVLKRPVPRFCRWILPPEFRINHELRT